MSKENVELVRRAVAAVNRRDIDAYLACCTDDVQLSTPLTEVTGVYEGPDGIRRFFADVGDTGPDFQLTIERVEPIGPDRVLVFMVVTATGRASGIPQDSRTGNVYDLAGGKIERIRIFADRAEALEVAGLRE
jgi:ketosteroid isomerase-like protein